jgi:hypothetical protein
LPDSYTNFGQLTVEQLKKRDNFIISKGLWAEFVESREMNPLTEKPHSNVAALEADAILRDGEKPERSIAI